MCSVRFIMRLAACFSALACVFTTAASKGPVENSRRSGLALRVNKAKPSLDATE